MRAVGLMLMVVIAVGCSSSTKGTGAKESSTSARTTVVSSIAHLQTSTSAFAGESPSEVAHNVLEAALVAARSFDGSPPDFGRLTAALFDEQIAVKRFGPISQAGPDVVGFASESPTRILFVIQVAPGGSWACAAVDDGGAGVSNPSFGHATTRDALATYAGCFQHT